RRSEAYLSGRRQHEAGHRRTMDAERGLVGAIVPPFQGHLRRRDRRRRQVRWRGRRRTAPVRNRKRNRHAKLLCATAARKLGDRATNETTCTVLAPVARFGAL